MAKFNQPATEFVNKPTTIDLSKFGFGKELYFGNDFFWSQPRKYLFNWPPATPCVGYWCYPYTKCAPATKHYININYDKGIVPMYSWFENGEALSTVNGRGRYLWQYTNYRAPMGSGYYNQSGTSRQRYLSDNLLNLEREFLKRKNTNFLYYQFGDYALWFYNETDGSVLPTSLYNAIDASQYGWNYETNQSYIKPFNEYRIKHFNAFWSAFSFIRMYISWAYFVIQYIEDVNKNGTSIGDDVYISVDTEAIYNGWWNGPAELGFGQPPEKPKLFNTPEEEQAHVQTIAEVIMYMKEILNNPAAMLALETPPDFVLRYWTDVPTAETIYTWDMTELKMRPPAATDVDFRLQWIELIENLPAKFRAPKIGIYGIPDVYWLDVDNSKDRQASGGWYGEELYPDNPAERPGGNKLWKFLSERSKAALNEIYVDKYKPLLDVVDIIIPQVYVFKPKAVSLGCTNYWGSNLEAPNKYGRDHFEDYVYHNVKRAALYNKKYGKNKPILPMISSGYPSLEEFTNAYKEFCTSGWYEPSVHNIPGNDDFVTDRFIDIYTLKNQIKLCFDAVEKPEEIGGFLWWNGQVPRIISYSGNENRFNPLTQTNPGEDPKLKYLELRRVYSLDVDRTVNAYDETKWIDNLYETHKSKVARKEAQLMFDVNRSVLYSETVGGITPEIDTETR